MTRQDIVVAVEATGVIDPRDAVQVKSKAAGQIVRMPVQVGSQVKAGALLVQIDPLEMQSRYNEAAAAVRSARENVNVATAQRVRADELFRQRVMTVTEHETALTAEANARAALASAQTNLTLASINLADVTIRAPISGTVIDKAVSQGQVISSATGNVSGGTTLLTLANLDDILDSALVNESDIGRVRPGQMATVSVDAYPNRVFRGTVERVAPEATVQQSVTMFPVLIGLDNREGLLKPGMNSDVTILVEQVDNVLAVPNDALTSQRDAASAAATLGVDPAAVRQAFQNAGFGRAGRRGSAGGVSGRDSGVGVQHGALPGGAVGGQGARGGGVGGPPGGQRQRGRGRPAGGVAGDTFRARGTPTATSATTAAATGATAPHRGLVFVAQNGTFVPRVVLLGVANYDVTEVVSGLREGERVALLSAAMLQQARDSLLARIRSRSALPGMGGSGAPSGGARGGGGAR